MASMEVLKRHPNNTRTNHITNTTLTWKATYAPGSRRVVRKTIEVGGTTYVLRRDSRKPSYRLSVNDHGNQYDLGEYRVRTAAERRLLEHLAGSYCH